MCNSLACESVLYEEKQAYYLRFPDMPLPEKGFAMGYELDAKIRLLASLRSLRCSILCDIKEIRGVIDEGCARDDDRYELSVLEYADELLQGFISGIHLND